MARTRKSDEGDYELTPEPQGLSLEDLIAALKAATGTDEASQRRQAQFQAEAMRRLQQPENAVHPGMSAYNPLGDLAHPRPPLKCQMFWVGYDLQPDNLTVAELELLNLARPGTFTFHRTDGAIETLTVTGRTNPDGSLERLEFYFPSRGDNKNNLPGMVAQLRECFGIETSERRLLADALAENARLLALLEHATAPA